MSASCIRKNNNPLTQSFYGKLSYDHNNKDLKNNYRIQELNNYYKKYWPIYISKYWQLNGTRRQYTFRYSILIITI